MRNFVIVNGKCYKIENDKAYEITWDFKTGLMSVGEKEAAIVIPNEKYNYNEIYKKLNIKHYIKCNKESELETKGVNVPQKARENVELIKEDDDIAKESSKSEQKAAVFKKKRSSNN